MATTATADGAAKKRTAPDASWTWHLCLSRLRMTIVPNSIAQARLLDPQDPNNLSVGWLLDVVRLEEDFDNDDTSNEKEEEEDKKDDAMSTLLSTDYIAKLKEEDPTLETRVAKLYDEPEEETGLVETCATSPLGVSVLMGASKRHLLDWVSTIDPADDEFPVTIVRDALNVLVRAEWDSKTTWYPDDNVNERLQSTLDDVGVTQQQWKDACRETPTRICLYLPSTLDKSLVDKIQTAVSNALPHATCTIHQERKMRTSDNNVSRLLWHLQFQKQMQLRSIVVGPDTKSTSGCRDFGTTDYWLHGKPLSNFPPSDTMDRLKHDYICVVRLLAERPWSVFAPYEALKVTLKMNSEDGETTETTKYILFSDGQTTSGDSKSDSPFGVMEILDEKTSVISRFGRSALFAQSGFFGIPQQYPDRLFVTTDPLSSVHYDHILLLEEIFGDSLLPGFELNSYMDFVKHKNLPAAGVVPLIEAQSGNIGGYPEEGENRPCRGRCFTKDEMKWLRFCSRDLLRFVKEEGSKCQPSDGVTLRTYPLAEGSVTVAYNMDIANGGLWDPEIKWMWF